MNKGKIIAIVLAAFIGISATVVTNDKLFEIAKNIELFVDVYKKLNASYVDEIDPSTLMRTGIDAMVNSLDPYTIYWSDSQMASGRLNSDKSYISIGASVDKINGNIIITEVDAEGPSGVEGVLSGDIILKINGESVKGMELDKVKTLMKGVKGTKMSLLLERPGLKQPFAVSIERGDKKASKNVPYFGRVDDNIGYVNLSVFTENASKNIKESIQEMNEKKPLEGLILDLRYNGGGLLREAVAVSNLFIEKGKTVVFTKSKVAENDNNYKTRINAFDSEIPLVVLINKRSASASEIVSGVIQDYDRGVLIGQKSFGKGLVQNFQQLGYSAQMKLTTHRYYIPSERCIQGYKYVDGEAVDIDKEEWQEFKTANGRKVYDGGGVSPDINMTSSELSPFTIALKNENIIFDYVNDYVSKHKTIAPAGEFKFDDYKSFTKFVKKKSFIFKSNLEKELGSLLDNEELSDKEKAKVKSMLSSIKNDEKSLLKRNRKEIENTIAAEIVGRYYFKQGEVEYKLQNDMEVERAIEILRNPKEYNKILGK